MNNDRPPSYSETVMDNGITNGHPIIPAPDYDNDDDDAGNHGIDNPTLETEFDGHYDNGLSAQSLDYGMHGNHHGYGGGGDQVAMGSPKRNGASHGASISTASTTTAPIASTSTSASPMPRAYPVAPPVGQQHHHQQYHPQQPPASSQQHKYRYHQQHNDSEQRFEVRRLPESRRAQPPARDYISPLVKCLMFSFNFLFWLIGMSIAGLGFWISIEKDKNVRDVLDIFFDPSILMCLAGCIIFSLGFFGCLGALRENICLLKTFHIILTVILLLELVLGIFIFIFYFVPSVREEIGFGSPEETLKEAIIRYRDDDDLRDVIDSIQKEFHCCGFSNNDIGYLDWTENVYFNCTPDNPSVERCGVPHSCCITTEGQMLNVMCGFDTTNKKRAEVDGIIYTKGCLKGFGQWLETNTIIIGAVCLGVMVPQLLGICLSRSLIDQIRQQKAQWRQQS